MWDGWSCRWQWCRGGGRTALGTRASLAGGLWSIQYSANHHQCGSNQLWCWKKMELKEKYTPTPPTSRLCFFSTPSHLTPCQWCRLFIWRDEQTNVDVLGKGTEADMPVVEATGRGETPQYSSQTLCSSCFLSLPQCRNLNTLYWYQTWYKHQLSDVLFML